MSKVNLEVANAEFERWAESNELSIDTSTFDQDELKSFEAFRQKFIARMQKGQLVVEDDGDLLFTPKGSTEQLRFNEPTGMLLSARMKNDDDTQAARRMLAQWTGAKPATFAEMPLRDFTFCSEILGFFVNS